MTITLAVDTSTDVRVGVAHDGVTLASGAFVGSAPTPNN